MNIFKSMILMLIVMLSLSSCASQEDDIEYFSDDLYEGFLDADVSLTRKECADLGYLVLEGISIKENYELIEEFINITNEGKSERLRIAHFNNDSNLTYSDLIYDEGAYYYYYMDQESLLSEAYDNLLVLEGQWGQPVQQYRMLVVSDDESLTFDDVTRVMVSSSMQAINDVGKHRVVLFKY